MQVIESLKIAHERIHQPSVRRALSVGEDGGAVLLRFGSHRVVRLGVGVRTVPDHQVMPVSTDLLSGGTFLRGVVISGVVMLR